MTIHVVVKKQHIESGRAGNQSLCPIALVFRELGFRDVDVEGTDCSFIHGNIPYYAVLPPLAREFIQDFDATISIVDPTKLEDINEIEFDLEAIRLEEE